MVLIFGYHCLKVGFFEMLTIPHGYQTKEKIVPIYKK